MNEPIFNLNRPYTIAIRQQWLAQGAANCMVVNFKGPKGSVACHTKQDSACDINRASKLSDQQAQ